MHIIINETEDPCRFKMAAHQNSDNWFQAKVELLGKPQIYNPRTQSFQPLDSEGSPVTMQGPFSYFLSTVNVDRLEPAFVITPLAQGIPPGTCDVVIVRPLRDPSLNVNGEEERKKFVDKIWSVMGGAYQGGKHIGLRYGSGGEIVGEVGEGEYVVEYVRCGGWRWTPVSEPSTCLGWKLNTVVGGGWGEVGLLGWTGG